MIFNKSLDKQLKKMEKELAKTFQLDTVDFWLEDGRCMQLTQSEYRQLWDDVRAGRQNDAYEALRKELEAGFQDEGGIIHLLMAEDPNEVKNIWADYEEEEGL